MEIAPIPGIRAVGAAEVRRRVLETPEIFEIDGRAKPGDGGVERAGRKAAGAEEPESDDLMLEDQDDSEAGGSTKNVDYFA